MVSKLFILQFEGEWLFIFGNFSINTMMKLILLLLVLPLYSIAHDSLPKKNKPFAIFYSTHPLQGVRGFKFGAAYSGTTILSAAIATSDLPRDKQKTREDRDIYEVCNQNLFLGTEYYFNNKLGIKAGYEINVMLLAAKFNYMNVFNLKKKENQPIFMPEIGLTMLGGINIMYGRSYPLDKKERLIAPNRISIYVNEFWLRAINQ
jgi:hypothetical protein